MQLVFFFIIMIKLPYDIVSKILMIDSFHPTMFLNFIFLYIFFVCKKCTGTYTSQTYFLVWTGCWNCLLKAWLVYTMVKYHQPLVHADQDGKDQPKAQPCIWKTEQKHAYVAECFHKTWYIVHVNVYKMYNYSKLKHMMYCCCVSIIIVICIVVVYQS
jgi:hypothetical protein